MSEISVSLMNTSTHSQDLSQLLSKAAHLLEEAYQDESLLDQAYDLFQQALSLDSTNENALLGLADITFKRADAASDKEQRKAMYQQTMDYAKTLLKSNPDSLDGQYWIGCCSARIGQLLGNASALVWINDAKKKMETLIKNAPDSPWAIQGRVVLSSIYTRLPWPMKDLKKAEKLAYEATQLDPNLTYASEKLSVVYVEQKKKVEARKELERCLAIAKPTYRWDSEHYNWPAARRMLEEL
ncbi:hypothetical protein WDW89_04640 [Deltaproteobacteria bacterium TL4]